MSSYLRKHNYLPYLCKFFVCKSHHISISNEIIQLLSFVNLYFSLNITHSDLIPYKINDINFKPNAK